MPADLKQFLQQTLHNLSILTLALDRLGLLHGVPDNLDKFSYKRLGKNIPIGKAKEPLV